MRRKRWKTPKYIMMCRYIGEPSFPTTLISAEPINGDFDRLRIVVGHDDQVEAWLRVITYSGDPVYAAFENRPAVGQWHIPDITIHDLRPKKIEFECRFLAPMGSPVTRRA